MRRTHLLIRIQCLLVMSGCVAVLYCAGILLAAQRYQSKAEREFQRSASELARVWAFTNSANVSSPSFPGRMDKAGFVGKLEVPDAGVSAIIAEGTDPSVLRVAVGHVTGTAFPWEPGNVALVAHRDTYFRGLGRLKVGDSVRIITPVAEYNYRVVFFDIVEPKETWVLQRGTGDSLTLITCYPFHFIGSAPKRFVVRARQLNVRK